MEWCLAGSKFVEMLVVEREDHVYYNSINRTYVPDISGGKVFIRTAAGWDLSRSAY
ncbi:hypothetical protein NSS70_18985 [Aeribacillus sp. FSL K6-2848]|uniref:hypothetical protein n=1 Tax=unclassified Aeribacillus TaxID=2640495 RepID=UPI0028720D80|nr:hypothetical protein [Aeribacillus pallidus]